MQRQCPMCGRMHEVADDGTIPTWLVSWAGDESLLPVRERKRYLSAERTARLDTLREKYGHKTEPEKTLRSGVLPNRVTCFIHYEDAVGEYAWMKNRLVERGDWIWQQDALTITEGERASWRDLFEEPGGWEA